MSYGIKGKVCYNLAMIEQRILNYSALYGAYVLFLHLIPGPWLQWKQKYPHKPIDPWTSQHIIWGIIAQKMDIKFNELLILGTLNEIIEVLVRRYRPEWLWGAPDISVNALFDLAANQAGWLVAKAYLATSS